MASPEEVKKYLAYWLQLGKKIIIPSLSLSLLPSKIIDGDRYSTEFEECWSLVINENTGDAYLEGTIPTVKELLLSKWEITTCARCVMPVPMIQMGIQSSVCVCSDVENWPNNELPPPRHPVSNQEKLAEIRNSLLSKKSTTQQPKESQKMPNTDVLPPHKFIHETEQGAKGNGKLRRI